MAMSILEQVRQIVADTLNLPLDAVGEKASTDTLDAWDSLAHVNLMMGLEQHFDLQLEIEDFMELTSIGAITTFLDKAGVN